MMRKLELQIVPAGCHSLQIHDGSEAIQVAASSDLSIIYSKAASLIEADQTLSRFLTISDPQGAIVKTGDGTILVHTKYLKPAPGVGETITARVVDKSAGGLRLELENSEQALLPNSLLQAERRKNGVEPGEQLRVRVVDVESSRPFSRRIVVREA